MTSAVIEPYLLVSQFRSAAYASVIAVLVVSRTPFDAPIATAAATIVTGSIYHLQLVPRTLLDLALNLSVDTDNLRRRAADRGQTSGVRPRGGSACLRTRETTRTLDVVAAGLSAVHVSRLLSRLANLSNPRRLGRSFIQRREGLHPVKHLPVCRQWWS